MDATARQELWDFHAQKKQQTSKATDWHRAMLTAAYNGEVGTADEDRHTRALLIDILAELRGEKHVDSAAEKKKGKRG